MSLFLLFGNDFGLDSPFFELFKTFILHTRLITTPHIHTTYVYSFSYVLCFSLHMITWPREVIIVL